MKISIKNSKFQLKHGEVLPRITRINTNKIRENSCNSWQKKLLQKKIPNPNRKIGIWNFILEFKSG
ncbi:hypothetical protein B0A72_14020 [Flavobacterium pectinovorum]|uniref:Uncharacterized protein n=1 Tax=Flavobacterium pectinovorum TaxID=29533 RepID=A0AB36NZ32_9FLAO|nr:hypothetical protein B0A72_14020 [Flavobacterium pectinovorum]